MDIFDFSKLEEWMRQNKAEKKAFDGFWLSFEDYRVSEQEEFEECFPKYEEGKLELKIDSVSINFSNSYPNFDYNHVIITIEVNYCGKNVGYYKILLNFDGSVSDDFFVIY